MYRRSSARSLAPARVPVAARHTNTTRASASVWRTVRLEPMCTSGSKSNAMTAIGTVAAVYKRSKCRLADSPPVGYPGGARCHTQHHHRHRADGGAAGRSGGDRGVWGPPEVPASAPGGRAGRRDRLRDGRRSTRPPTMTGLDITLLGRVSIRTAHGREIRLIGRHVQALFTLLALTRRPRTREAIATDLWPESLVAATGPLRQACTSCGARWWQAASRGLDPRERR